MSARADPRGGRSDGRPYRDRQLGRNNFLHGSSALAEVIGKSSQDFSLRRLDSLSTEGLPCDAPAIGAQSGSLTPNSSRCLNLRSKSL